VLATGGKSYPKLGSTGDGFEFAKMLGHKIVPTYPMNTPIISHDSFIQSKVLQGLTLPDVNIIYRSKSFRGSMIFTHFGISGPIVLNISKDVHFGLETHNEVFIDLIPDESIETIRNGYLKDGKPYLIQFLPKRLVEYLIERFEVNKNASEISKKSLTSFVEGIKRFKITVAGLKGYENAFITGGGVDLKDVNPKTMESKVLFNLYIVGEVLDLQGITGGYNHTIALTTGYVAGNSL
jgi:predicted Rossmann fold flavoprotein